MAASGFAVPDRDQLIDEAHEDYAARHVCCLVRFGHASAVDVRGSPQQLVVDLVVPIRKAIAVLIGWDDHLQASTAPECGLGRPGVRAIGNARHHDEFVSGIALESLIQKCSYALFYVSVKSSMTSDSNTHGMFSLEVDAVESLVEVTYCLGRSGAGE